ncbi:FAD/NAD(P)-binding domain-containing protein [Annulohypoxylon maeteangense]|uniref:FAD/NAD(P)-binding domain-containing protein n=1 Tax=Annulohypoxylon maeteangense TaxID=1927788 RepID=UPI0020083D60|nr:FAD/NAD(P)-binding domain-containing protein [Annulohypoxylon maeteangense]KAI0884422.1 FAD/NAD(P)-binding domain-containing protein [Annulohypoxylon maeteangense]
MAEASESAKLPILIIGAGITGLAIASGLHQKNIPYILFDKDPSLSPRNERDWGIACHWAAPLLASLAGAAKWSRVASTLVDPNLPIKEIEHFPLYNGKTGELIVRPPIPNLHRILRSRMRALIAEGLDIRFAKNLVGLEYAADGGSVTVCFEDGTRETGRLVVGADGSQSRVRRLLLGAEKAALKRLPIAATFVTASFPAEQARRMREAVHPIINGFVHPDDMMGMFAILDGADAERPENWSFAFYISWQSSLEEQAAEAAAGMGVRERLRQGKEKGRLFAEPLRSCYELVSDDCEKVYYVANGNWDPSLPEHEWDNRGGRVTLVGDAAHPLTYHRGQGLNQSIKDAYELVALLTEPGNRTQAELIGAFESEMRPRAGEEVRMSELNTLMLHSWDKLQQSPLMQRGVAYGSEAKEDAAKTT